MIPFNFVYYRPESIDEAVRAYTDAESEGLNPLYYGGGTEIVTFARDRIVKPGAVIDIKRILECVELREDGERVILGAGLPLGRVIKSMLFPLLGAVAGGIADHTVRNRLTLGGNVAGRLPYREAVLPLLLSDAELLVAGPAGKHTLKATELFEKRLRLEKGELFVQARIPKSAVRARWKHVRREKGTHIDYPILSASFLRMEGRTRLAVSGLLNFPFRDNNVDRVINEGGVSSEERAEAAIEHLPGAIRHDQRASAEYRRHLFKRCLIEGIEELEQER